MISVLPQVEKISVLKSNQEAVLAKVKRGPVLLMQRSNPAVVMVSPEQWDAVAQRLRELEWREEVRQAALEAHNSQETDLSLDQFMTELQGYHEPA
jgi:PHD/YefM family antitoxin component YafN of YafNO toxin-antitoxin module